VDGQGGLSLPPERPAPPLIAALRAFAPCFPLPAARAGSLRSLKTALRAFAPCFPLPAARAGSLRSLKAALRAGQVTWNGHPLYTFASDTAGGNPTGDGVGGFHLAVVSGSTSPASSSTTAASGSRY
jgi:hypothetical protein